DNFSNTTFDDEAATAITSGGAPFTGRFRPVGSLAAFDGQSVLGNWTLEVIDRAGGDVGTLNNWSLAITLADGTVLTQSSANVPRFIADLATTTSSLNITAPTPGYFFAEDGFSVTSSSPIALDNSVSPAAKTSSAGETLTLKAQSGGAFA